MNATALIAEDEPLLAQALEQDLARLWPGLQVVARAGDGLSALHQALQHAPRVCFLDIRMPGLDGLALAEAMAEDWDERHPFPLLVFVTAYDQHALQAFEREAVDYLLKPVEPARLAQCVQRLQRRLVGAVDGAVDGNSATGAAAAGPPAAVAPALADAVEQLRRLLQAQAPAAAPALDRLTMLPIGQGSSVRLVPVDDIVYLEAADKYLRVLTDDAEHLIRLSLKELLPRLDPEQFWQVHRGVVVRVRRIERALRDESGRVTLQLRGRAERLPVSRVYASRFRGL